MLLDYIKMLQEYAKFADKLEKIWFEGNVSGGCSILFGGNFACICQNAKKFRVDNNCWLAHNWN
jgi:hypothetical protein